MGAVALKESTSEAKTSVDPTFDWKKIAYLLFVSRALDQLEETKLMPEKKVLYQFSARGHDLAQIMLGSLLTNSHDAAGAYYRSRPLLLALGLSIEDALAGPMAMSGGFSDGRDIGVVCNLPGKNSPTVLPMSGDVGSQFTPIAGWAQAILYHRNSLKDSSYNNSIGVVLGGEASVATNGFWSALTMATTLQLPMLFYIEDNGFGISVTSDKQTPGANIAQNLAAFRNLKILDGDGTEPKQAGTLMHEAVDYVRAGNGSVLLRLTVPRLSGHSGQDTQGYKSPELIESEKARDPLPKLQDYFTKSGFSSNEWEEIERRANNDVAQAFQTVIERIPPNPETITRYVFSEQSPTGQTELQLVGGIMPTGHKFPKASENPTPEPTRINMLTSVRRTLEFELKTNPRVLVFGEDVGAKGGVHAATLGLMDTFGEDRVFDTSLSEEGIIGRAVGMALCGLMPVAEIQFRKYADPATEQLNNCGTIRWRTANRFAAPIVVRMPGGFAKCGDPWHSVSSEVLWAHAVGWQVAFPSNAEDAAGLLRTALRSNNPTIFFEHRNLLDSAWARRPYPGDDFIVPFGRAQIIESGSEATIVTWGAMVERCELAVKESGASVEILDLRTISPWDKEAVVASVNKTRRCMIVHEDGLTAGFGSEISATLTEAAFFSLDAPIMRVAVPDIPIPYNVELMEAVVPTTERILSKLRSLLET